MSQIAIQEFKALVMLDSSEAAELRRTLEILEDVEAFVTTAVDIARRRGLDLEADEVRSAMQASRRAWIERWL